MVVEAKTWHFTTSAYDNSSGDIASYYTNLRPAFESRLGCEKTVSVSFRVAAVQGSLSLRRRRSAAANMLGARAALSKVGISVAPAASNNQKNG